MILTYPIHSAFCQVSAARARHFIMSAKLMILTGNAAGGLLQAGRTVYVLPTQLVRFGMRLVRKGGTSSDIITGRITAPDRGGALKKR